MEVPIRAFGQESLQDFIRTIKDNLCGDGKPYAGLLILFDEFGRYLEFAVRRPHIAGDGALQQLYEAVQANDDAAMLVCFIQYELKAYVSRVAPELRDELEQRYVSRYESFSKVRLSTNLETLIANLLDKIDPEYIEKELEVLRDEYDEVYSRMQNWFSEIKGHSLWRNKDLFHKTICEGCWPLHPLSVLTLYKLSTIEKSLQQRSAFTLLAEAYEELKNKNLAEGQVIVPVDLCNASLINEFLSSERFGQEEASAHAYEAVMDKYSHELSDDHVKILKSVLLSSKLSAKVYSKEEYAKLIAEFSRLDEGQITNCLEFLENELAVLGWNEQISRYEITGDSVPKRAFLAHLQNEISQIDSDAQASIFAQNYKTWAEMRELYPTDFGAHNRITTQDWHYNVSLSNVEVLKGKIDFAVKTWLASVRPDEPKGQLIYCYVGSNSDLESVKQQATTLLREGLEENDVSLESGAPIAVMFLHDREGVFGQKLAEYWVLENEMNEDDFEISAVYRRSETGIKGRDE